jgi:hypothetical protein
MESDQLMRKQRGALLGIVMILLVLILAASGFAFWTMRADTNATGNDRLSRQLFDCAEQALALGKQTFAAQRSAWDSYLGTDVCTSGWFPCPPFPTGATGTAPLNYPTGGVYTGTIKVGLATDVNGNTNTRQQSYTYKIGIYNDKEIACSAQATTDPTCSYHDGNDTVVVYARCTDPSTNQWRATQAVLTQKQTTSGCPYRAQAGASCRGNGNQN